MKILHYNDTCKGDRAIKRQLHCSHHIITTFKMEDCNDKIKYLEYEKLSTDSKCVQ